MTWTYLAVFVSMAAYDTAWARYVLAVSRKQHFAGALWAAALPIFLAIMSRAFVADFSTVVPAALGAFVGTYVTTKWTK